MIVVIKVGITEDGKELGKMKKQLASMERVVVREFTSTHAPNISSDKFIASLCQALLNVLSTVFILILKHDMCQGVTLQHRSMLDLVDRSFTMADNHIESCFDGAGDCKATKSLRECLYYVAEWHARTIKKASVRRRDCLRELMSTVYSNIIFEKNS